MSSQSKIIVEISEMPKLKNPHLICGLPGSGYVGKIAVDYLIEELKGVQFANIFSSSFPPQVSIQDDGTIDLMKNTLYYCKNKPDDIVLLTGDAQPVTPESEYAMAEEIIGICEKLGVKNIYTLAAFITGTFTMNGGSITGMNGLVIGAGKTRGITGVCLLGETSGYVVDAKASKAILEILSKILGLKLDMTTLIKKAQDTDQLIKTVEEQMGQRQSTEQLPLPSQDKKLGYIS